MPKRNYTAPYLSELLTYTSEARWLKVYYRSEHHRRWLQMKPGRVFTSGGFWYCEAYSITHGEERTFRVDRMDALEVMDGAAEAEEQLNKSVQERKARVQQEEAPIRIRAKLSYLGMLRAEQDEHIGECIRAVSDEEWELDCRCPSSEWQWFIRFFYSLGMEAEVLEPAALRHEIRQIALQMCDRYDE
ncbi:helix-turn-helix transcriptional regulator [Paenibacillus solisilvae]|uniref:Helix-turn-helix transcriptional regulator n=1 Tax=Paenibacillus solisilvae TaxID=2486751 RepID=A0ABW0W090_9BACL